MKKVISIIKEILLWAIILFAFSLIGLPSNMVPFWGIAGLVIFGIGYIFIRNHRRQSGITKGQIIRSRVMGSILVLFACFLPNIAFRDAGFSMSVKVLLVIASILLIALGILAISLINRHLRGQSTVLSSILGYVLLFILALVPAALMSTYDMSYNALGTVYYIVIGITLFSWFGISMIMKKSI